MVLGGNEKGKASSKKGSTSLNEEDYFNKLNEQKIKKLQDGPESEEKKEK